MKIDSYKILISNLPVRQQCFTTKRTTWQKAEKKFEWLTEINNKIFDKNLIVSISRQDIIGTESLREQIIKTIYWGYTGGMRGNNFLDILENIALVESTLKQLKQSENSNEKDFEQLRIIFKQVRGLGLSTYSKLLYFANLTFESNSCLILDQRLIDVFSAKIFSDFEVLKDIRYPNAENKYLQFLRVINRLSEDLGTRGENIEQFLFIFGKNLKD